MLRIYNVVLEVLEKASTSAKAHRGEAQGLGAAAAALGARRLLSIRPRACTTC